MHLEGLARSVLSSPASNVPCPRPPFNAHPAPPVFIRTNTHARDHTAHPQLAAHNFTTAYSRR